MSEHHSEHHSSPGAMSKRMIVVVVASFLLPIGLIVVLSQLLTAGGNSNSKAAMSDEAIAERLKPVGQVEVADANASKAEKSGKEIVEAVCSACHTSGALGAPKIGDKAGWAARNAQGLDRLTENAIKGIKQMPARGGNPDLTDTEIMRSIVFMANQSGASFQEPAAKAAAAK